MNEVRRRRWLVGIAALVVVMSTLACGGGEYAMVSPDSDLSQQLKDEGSRVLSVAWGYVEGVLSTVWEFVEGLLQDVLDLVGVSYTGGPLEPRFAWHGDG